MTPSTDPDFTDRRLFRRVPATCFASAVLGLIWFVFLFGCQRKQEPALPARILGGSMAPAFLGDHYQCKCEDCQFEFQFDFASAPKQYAVCPNCGFDKNLIENAAVRPAQRVKVDPPQNGAAENWRRWDVVAFRHPEKPNEFGVKRIVGLPNERFEINGGDIFVDGAVLRKDYAEQRQMATLVFDNQFRATSQNEFARWKSQFAPSGWKMQTGSLTFSDKESENRSTLDWIDYQHVRGYLGVGSPRDVDAIEDADSYNQTKVRTLNRVRDLAVDLQIDGFRQGTFSLRFNHLDKPIRIDFYAGDGVSVFIGEELQKALQWPNDFGAKTSIYLSVFDQQILLAVNEQTMAGLPCDLPLSRPPTTTPISIGATDSQFKLSSLKIYRDVFYLDKYGQGGNWSSDGDGFIVLGDNAPISIDSRHWEPARMPAHSIIGRVFKINQ